MALVSMLLPLALLAPRMPVRVPSLMRTRPHFMMMNDTSFGKVTIGDVLAGSLKQQLGNLPANEKLARSERTLDA